MAEERLVATREYLEKRVKELISAEELPIENFSLQKISQHDGSEATFTVHGQEVGQRLDKGIPHTDILRFSYDKEKLEEIAQCIIRELKQKISS